LISFRFHLVSIVAVFLALALGVLLGTTVVNQGVIDDLNGRVDDAVTRSHQLRDQVAGLQSDVRGWEAFGRSVEPLLVSNQLPGQPVVMVTLEGVDLSEVDGVRQSLQDSGATVESVLFVTPRMALTDAGSQTQLSAILGDVGGATDPARMAEDAAQRLAARLATGAPVSTSPSDTSGPQDLLGEMVDAGFVAVRGGSGSLVDIGGPNTAVIILAGGSQDLAVSPDSFLEPLAASLAVAGRPVVATETVETAYPFVPLVRRDGVVNGKLVTVDNADTMVGRIAVVLGLRDLLQTPGHGGHYGVKPGATSLIPKP
jgi:Copper transport outer membrane protein, MctB